MLSHAPQSGPTTSPRHREGSIKRDALIAISSAVITALAAIITLHGALSDRDAEWEKKGKDRDATELNKRQDWEKSELLKRAENAGKQRIYLFGRIGYYEETIAEIRRGGFGQNPWRMLMIIEHTLVDIERLMDAQPLGLTADVALNKRYEKARDDLRKMHGTIKNIIEEEFRRKKDALPKPIAEHKLDRAA